MATAASRGASSCPAAAATTHAPPLAFLSWRPVWPLSGAGAPAWQFSVPPSPRALPPTPIDRRGAAFAVPGRRRPPPRAPRAVCPRPRPRACWPRACVRAPRASWARPPSGCRCWNCAVAGWVPAGSRGPGDPARRSCSRCDDPSRQSPLGLYASTGSAGDRPPLLLPPGLFLEPPLPRRRPPLAAAAPAPLPLPAPGPRSPQSRRPAPRRLPAPPAASARDFRAPARACAAAAPGSPAPAPPPTPPPPRRYAATVDLRRRRRRRRSPTRRCGGAGRASGSLARAPMWPSPGPSTILCHCT